MRAQVKEKDDQPSLELRLLLAAAHLEQSQSTLAVLAGLLGEGVDWPRFLLLVDRHRVAPLVYRSLKPFQQRGVEPEQLQLLRERVERNTENALLQAGELRRIQQQMQKLKLPWLVFKGPVLAVQAYGDLTLRHAGDLDLLVPMATLPTAEAVVAGMDYERVQPEFHLTPRQWRTYRHYFADFGYLHRRHGLNLELHWRLFGNPRQFPLSASQLIGAAHPLAVAGTQVVAMAWADLLLYLCAHGAKHGWFRLFWLVDVDVLMRGCSPQQQQALLARARELGVDRTLLQGVVLANRLLETPVDGALLQAADAEPVVGKLVRMARRAIAGPETLWSEEGGRGLTEALAMMLYASRLRRGLAFQWRELLSKLVNPPDWQRLPLPDMLFFLYFPLRPFLRLWRWRGEP